VSNPKVVDITTIGDSDLLINAKDAGVANLLVWDSKNNVASYDIESTLHLERIHDILHGIDPDASLDVVPFNDTFAVYGTVDTSLQLQRIDDAAKAFDEDAITFTNLKDSKQILLEVRFAEINRKRAKDFKLDTEVISRYFAVRNLTGQTGSSTVDSDSSFAPKGSPVTYEQIGLPSEQQVNLFGAYVDENTLATNFLQWLESMNILKLIARPNLLAKDGEEAEFVVGGEFPVPIATEDRISIDYKEFGTKLKFTPEVLDDTLIRLAVETEVSELDFSTTVTFGGIVVPSIIKRTHKTISELEDKQSLVIGGLISQKISRVERRVPIFGSIPLVGRAFRSDALERNDVELVVVITPHLVKPFEMDQPKEFYDPKTVQQATTLYAPFFPDYQGDGVHQMIAQQERLLQLGEEPLTVMQVETHPMGPLTEAETITQSSEVGSGAQP